MKVRYSESKKIKPEQINELRYTIGWNKQRFKSNRNWTKILKKSDFVISAWNGKMLVGFGRAFDDSVMFMIYDLMTRKEYQRKGIGTAILKKLLKKAKNKKNYSFIGLFTSNAKSNEKIVEFYEKLGFKKASIAMKLKV